MPPFSLPGGVPSKQEAPEPFTIEDFGGIDTKAKRPAIGPKDFFWIENWMPIGPGNLRTLYDREEDPIYEAVNPREIIYYTFFNLGAERLCAVFLDNGTAVQVNTDTLATTTITASANTFWDGSGPLPHATQYQAKYLAITSKVDDDAYWLWDGTSLFGPGTLAPQVTVINSGGDAAYSGAPTITAYGGAGSGATFSATVSPRGHITEVEVTNPGSGYDHEDLVTLVFTGGGASDQARATATVTTSSGGVGQVLITNGGTAPYSAPVVTFAGGGGSGAKAFVSGATNGVITDITVYDPGTGYTSAPTVTIADSGGGTGAGATAVAVVRAGQITAITVNSGGTGYTAPPDVVISEPNDFGFPNIPAEAYATVAAGVVTAITIVNPGLGYKSASVQLEGGNNSAQAEVKVMPAGISGTSIETYQERLWVGDDTKFSYTAAASVSDFSGASGGGSKPATDAFLREKITRMIQANGFLYRMGDSSINVISNVQTSVNAVTTFNDSNVDPQIGTAWRDSVAAFGRALVFANPTGVYAIYGGAAEKVSSALDGLFATASFNTNSAGLTPTAAVGTLFGIRVYCLLFTTVDPRDGASRDLIAMWDGQRWFIGSQTLATEILAGQEINSTLTAYGASPTAIHRLFHTASDSLTKVFQTKLAAFPTYFITSQVERVYFIARLESGATGTLDISIENQGGPNAAAQRPVGSTLTFLGAGGVPIQFIGAGSVPLNFSAAGLVVDGFDYDQYGELIGATVTTDVGDLTLITMSILLKPYAPVG
jgi:hypothetical protein